MRKMQASGLPECIPSVCTSAIWGQSGFLVHTSPCIPPAPWHSPWRVTAYTGSLGSLIHIWRPEITDGGGISCLLLWRKTLAFHNTSQYWSPSCLPPDAWVWRIGAERQTSPSLHKRYGRGRWVSPPLRLRLFTRTLCWSLWLLRTVRLAPHPPGRDSALL